MTARTSGFEGDSRPKVSLLIKRRYTREIRVILYAKDDPFCATALADELPIEDILAVEHDIVPFDWADVLQQGEIDSIGERVALTRRHLSSCTKSSSVRVAARLSWSRENIDGIIPRPEIVLLLPRVKRPRSPSKI